MNAEDIIILLGLASLVVMPICIASLLWQLHTESEEEEPS